MRTLRTGGARTGRLHCLKIPSMLVAIAVAAGGCTFSWDEAGIKDVSVAGRSAGELGPQEEPKPPGTDAATNADAATTAGAATTTATAATGKKAEEDDGEKTSLRKIAILPVAYRDASGGQACDLCPSSADIKPSSALSARLVTGFIYEAIARHPRLLFPPPEVVERTIAAAPGRSMRAAATSLAEAGKADLLVAAELLELRPRIGPDDRPEKPAGAAIYASLVDAHTGEVLWSDTFDQDESGRNVMLRTYDRIINDKPVRWRTAEEFSEHAVDELIEDLVDEVD